ncbi:MAG: hypothetical protein K1X88_22690 [Nannocystaceae bacterium]|nr:hypothetical protein [Nannocystaceae bacterium]
MGFKKLLRKVFARKAAAQPPVVVLPAPPPVEEDDDASEGLTRCDTDAQPPPPAEPRIVVCRWSVDAIEPVHPFSWPSLPDRADDLTRIHAGIDIRTEGVDDGTAVTLAVHHVAIHNTDVSAACPVAQRPDPAQALTDHDGLIANLEIRGGRVVDRNSGQPPFFRFDERQELWAAWRRPRYELRVTVQANPPLPATSSEFDSTLLLRGWHIMLTDHSDAPAPTAFYTNVGESIAAQLTFTAEHRAEVAGTRRNVVPLAAWGAIFRNTYSVLNVSHGYIYERAVSLDTDEIYHGVPVPLRSIGGGIDGDKRWYPEPDEWGNYRSVMRYGQRANANYTKHSAEEKAEHASTTRFGDASFANVGAVPTTPRYLWMMNSCRTMAEPSLADALHARGTWFVIGWIYAAAAHECRQAVCGFYTAWRDAGYDPDVVPALFRAHFLQSFAGRGPTLSIAPAVAQALNEQTRIAASLQELA